MGGHSPTSETLFQRGYGSPIDLYSEVHWSPDELRRHLSDELEYRDSLWPREWEWKPRYKDYILSRRRPSSMEVDDQAAAQIRKEVAGWAQPTSLPRSRASSLRSREKVAARSLQETAVWESPPEQFNFATRSQQVPVRREALAEYLDEEEMEFISARRRWDEEREEEEKFQRSRQIFNLFHPDDDEDEEGSKRSDNADSKGAVESSDEEGQDNEEYPRRWMSHESLRYQSKFRTVKSPCVRRIGSHCQSDYESNCSDGHCSPMQEKIPLRGLLSLGGDARKLVVEWQMQFKNENGPAPAEAWSIDIGHIEIQTFGRLGDDMTPCSESDERQTISSILDLAEELGESSLIDRTKESEKEISWKNAGLISGLADAPGGNMDGASFPPKDKAILAVLD